MKRTSGVFAGMVLPFKSVKTMFALANIPADVRYLLEFFSSKSSLTISIANLSLDDRSINEGAKASITIFCDFLIMYFPSSSLYSHSSIGVGRRVFCNSAFKSFCALRTLFWAVLSFTPLH